MTDEQLQVLRHSLGLDQNGHGNQYRNYYCDRTGGSPVIVGLCKLGLMVSGNKINDGRDQYFYVTEAGRLAALKDVKPIKMSKGRKRYLAFLHADSGMKFGDWLKTKWAKEVR